jgi:glycosyltransferase involved in cell wall biosynthesis
MRILYHHRTLGDGAEGIHIAAMVDAFRALGHEVRVVSLIGEATNVATPKQKRWSRLARLMPRAVYELCELGYNVPGAITLDRAARAFKPDFIYDRYVNQSCAALIVARRRGIPVLLEVNSPYSYQKQTFDEKLILKRFSRWNERMVCRSVDRVIVVSSPLKQFLVGIGVPAEQIIVMPNGANPEVFHPGISGLSVRRTHGLEGQVIVGFSGILRPWHGLDLLLDAFERVAAGRNDVHLMILGDGPVRSELESSIAAKGLTRQVTITGRVPHARVREYVAAMDITVSPHSTFYASPMKVLEYMAMAKAIVAPDTANHRDILTTGRTALLFEPGRVEALAGAVGRLVADAQLRHVLGSAARHVIETERTWAHNAREVIAMVERLRRPGAASASSSTATPKAA